MWLLKAAWVVVTSWAMLVLLGVGYYAYRWLTEAENPARHELVLGASIVAIWIVPAVLSALLLSLNRLGRESAGSRVGWAALGTVVIVSALLVAIAAVAT